RNDSPPYRELVREYRRERSRPRAQTPLRKWRARQDLEEASRSAPLPPPADAGWAPPARLLGTAAGPGSRFPYPSRRWLVSKDREARPVQDAAFRGRAACGTAIRKGTWTSTSEE